MNIANGMVMPMIRALRRLPRNEHDDHEAYALEDGFADPVDRRIDKVSAVDIGHNLHVIRFQPFVEFDNLGVDTLNDLRGIVATQQQNRSLDVIVLLVLAENAVTLLIGELELAEIAEEDRCAVALRDHDCAHLIERLYQADAADHISSLAAGHDTAAGACAVGIDGSLDVGER